MATTNVTISVTASPTVAITVARPPAVTIGVTSTGPRGPAGDTVTAVAASALSGHRCVAWQADGTVDYADNTNTPDAWAAVGVTDGAVIQGAIATLRTFGKMVEGSWSWTPLGLIYLGTNGLLTQTAPSGPAFLRVLGHAIDATSMWIDVQQPIIQT